MDLKLHQGLNASSWLIHSSKCKLFQQEVRLPATAATRTAAKPASIRRPANRWLWRSWGSSSSEEKLPSRRGTMKRSFSFCSSHGCLLANSSRCNYTRNVVTLSAVMRIVLSMYFWTNNGKSHQSAAKTFQRSKLRPLITAFPLDPLV